MGPSVHVSFGRIGKASGFAVYGRTTAGCCHAEQVCPSSELSKQNICMHVHVAVEIFMSPHTAGIARLTYLCLGTSAQLGEELC